jgi:hypothetical protein
MGTASPLYGRVVLDSALTTRPITGVDWTVDSAVIDHNQRHPKSIPILIREFKRKLAKEDNKTTPVLREHSSSETPNLPIQLELLP